MHFDSVQLLRRVDTRIPTPLLSSYITTVASPPSLGKLADFRNIRATQSPSWRSLGASNTPAPRPQSAGASTSSTTANSRGWTSVVAKSTTPTPMPPPAPAALANPRPAATLVGTSAAALTSRHASPAGFASHTRPPSASAASVPDNWEDDV